jgi:hypothetical protein
MTQLTGRREVFDALCDLMIYHYVDMCRPKWKGRAKFRRSVNLLKKLGVIESQDEPGKVWGEYEAWLADYVASRCPDHFMAVGYYGERGFARENEKLGLQGLCVGDACGQYMFFDDSQALEEYVSQFLRKLSDE